VFKVLLNPIQSTIGPPISRSVLTEKNGVKLAFVAVPSAVHVAYPSMHEGH